MSVHLIITTHTTRHLQAVLKGASLLDPSPKTISVTCDVSEQRIRDLVAACAQSFSIEIIFTHREHHNKARPAQTRNNALRALIERGHSTGLLVFLDGDMVLEPDALAKHQRLAEKFNIIACERLNLTKEQTPGFAKELIDCCCFPSSHDQSELKRLRKVDQKRNEHALFRKFGMEKPMKPKITGCHFSIRFEDIIKLNGLDERFIGYGAEDDDLARRCHKLGLRYHTAARKIIGYHLYHPTRSTGKWADNDGPRVFQTEQWETHCIHGLENPLPQHAPLTEILTP